MYFYGCKIIAAIFHRSCSNVKFQVMSCYKSVKIQIDRIIV